MSKFDIYQAVTDRIIDEIQKGIIPWEKPWRGAASGAVNWKDQHPYSLINQFLLGCAGEYASFKQIAEAGGKVKKGSKAKMVVFWKMLKTEKKDEFGNVVKDVNGMPVPDKTIPILKYYNVFNIETDVEGLEPKRKENIVTSEFNRIDKAEEIMTGYVNRSGVVLKYQLQDRAYYSPAFDEVVLPKREQFVSESEFYSTAFHELTHSTGHSSRLDRFSGNSSISNFGDSNYSKEELVAEIGSAGILSMLGIETEKSFRNSAAYVQGWLKALRNDSRMIISAASKADKAIQLILGDAYNTMDEE